MIKDKRAFAPFGVGQSLFHPPLPQPAPRQGRSCENSRLTQTFIPGRRTCVGKILALTQIRLVTAILLMKYRIRLAPGEMGDAVERDMKDQLTAQPGKCRVVFEAR